MTLLWLLENKQRNIYRVSEKAYLVTNVLKIIKSILKRHIHPVKPLSGAQMQHIDASIKVSVFMVLCSSIRKKLKVKYLYNY